MSEAASQPGPAPEPVVPGERVRAFRHQASSRRRHGRKDLPWQQEPTPYRVWVSEVMLQQTQVATVLPYYLRFLERFPDLRALAAAPLDEVLHLWSGLGYYGRARRLHQAAREVVARHGGELPDDEAELARLPGIGPSTAAAIQALARDRPAAILDGNAQRVLARLEAVQGWPGASPVRRRLWAIARAYAQGRSGRRYTQALMDLGATLCTPRAPACDRCPVAGLCRARAAGLQEELPAPPPGRHLPLQRTQMLLLCRRGRVLLLRRPPAGLWGGLWSLPEAPPEADPLRWCREQLGWEAAGRPWPALVHPFSHFRLEIRPWLLEARRETGGRLREGGEALWYNPLQPPALGLPTPVARLLRRLEAEAGDPAHPRER